MIGGKGRAGLGRKGGFARGGGGRAAAGVFGIRYRAPRFSDEELVAELRRYARATRRRRFSARAFNRWRDRRCAAVTIAVRLGSWNKGLQRAGFFGGKHAKYTPLELVRHLERVWRELGRAPGIVAMRRAKGVTEAPYQRVWGSLAKACAALARHKRGEISREELLRGTPRENRRVVIPARVRWTVLGRDGMRCVVCGQGAADGVRLEVDHIEPVCAGGDNRLANLRTLCVACNRGKAGRRGKIAAVARARPRPRAVLLHASRLPRGDGRAPHSGHGEPGARPLRL